VDGLLIPLIVGCAVALLSALGVVLARRPVHGAVALLVHSLSIAGLFLLLAADMVAVGQLIIYSGAIVVLFLFVVALLPTGGIEGPAATSRIVAALVGGGALLVALGAALSTPLPALADGPLPGIADIGRALFGPLVVAFELTAPLLLVALIGAVTIWRRQAADQ
jgi:NADH-quinone oxidoreductase subunit J